MTKSYGGRTIGKLRRKFLKECESRGCSFDDLSVLDKKHDPYRKGSDIDHAEGEWVAEQIARAFGAERKSHIRGLHYAIVVEGKIIKPDGAVYRNTGEDWEWLMGATKAARWLGYVDFERIVDNKNSPPIIHRKPELSWRSSLATGIIVPTLDEFEPRASLADFEGRQPYALAIFGEKSSLEEILLPIAQRFEADLYLPSGEISDTLLFQIAKDADADGRPLVVFVFADFDPAGRQMAVSIGRKLQAFRDLKFPNLKFAVVPAGLTFEQARDLGLPSTPLKEEELRADKWREEFDWEQTEIDAVLQLRPDALQQIAEDAIAPYFDDELADRVAAAIGEWHDEAQGAIDSQISRAESSKLRKRYIAAVGEIQAVDDRIVDLCEGVELPEPVMPESELTALSEKSSRLGVLVSSEWTWVEQTLALKDRKTYGAAAKARQVRKAKAAERKAEAQRKRDVWTLRRAPVVAALKAGPTRSDNAIATECGVHNETVAVARGRLERAGEIPRLNRTMGADGIVRSTRHRKGSSK